MTVRVAPSEQRYRDVEVRRSLIESIVARTRDLPGVVSAGAIHFLPIADAGPSIYFLPNPADPETVTSSGYRVITPGYLETMRIPVRAGRVVEASDQVGSLPIGLVNRNVGGTTVPGTDPIGQTLYRTNGRLWFTVVGVVGDVRQAALGLPPREEIYLPAAQSAWASAMTVVARTDGLSPTLGESIQSIVRSEDANVPVTRVQWMDDVIRVSVASPRFYSALFSLFAVLALTLGGVGVYGVASYVANERSRHIGIQVALGATSARIMRTELRRGILIMAAGVGIGSVAAFLSSQLVSGMLYEVSPFDPLLLVGASGVLAAVAFVGMVWPARRASRADPMSMLRVN